MLLFCLLILAAIQDIRFSKISNRLIVTGLGVGLLFQVMEHQVLGVYFFMRNVSVPVILLYLFFQMRVLGAGDIKLFSMIGSILTIQELYRCMVYGFLAGGLMAGGLWLLDTKRRQKIIHAGSYLWQVLKAKEILVYQPLEGAEPWKFAFSVPIVFGVIGALYFPEIR